MTASKTVQEELERLRQYMLHLTGCRYLNGGKCDCGFDAVLRSLRRGLKEGL